MRWIYQRAPRTLYDHHTSELFSDNLDTLALSQSWPTFRRRPPAHEATFKLTWHPDLRAVIIGARKMHAYEVDSGKLTTWSRPDSYLNSKGNKIVSSTLFYDPDTRDVVGIGSIDWESAVWAPNYWRIQITP